MKPDDIIELSNKIEALHAKKSHVIKHIDKRITSLEVAANETDAINPGDGNVFRLIISELESIKRKL